MPVCIVEFNVGTVVCMHLVNVIGGILLSEFCTVWFFFSILSATDKKWLKESKLQGRLSIIWPLTLIVVIPSFVLVLPVPVVTIF